MKTVRFWDKLAKHYDRQVLKKYDRTYEEMVELSKKYLHGEDRVLDFGCGTGLTTVRLAREVKNIHAIDLSEEMILIARNRAEGENIKNINFGVLDIYSDDIRETYDVIIAFNILHFIHDTDGILTRINDLLKPDGYFISVTDCMKDRRTGGSTLQSLMSKIGIVPEFKKFRSDELKDIVRRNRFTVVYDKVIYDRPANYFMAAKKQTEL